MASNPRKRIYNKISYEQRNILEKYYERGMTGAGSLRTEAITNVSKEAGIAVDQVKKWIGNSNKKKKKACNAESSEETVVSTAGTPSAKIPTGVRGQSAYNVFCGEFFQSDECKNLASMEERNRFAGRVWKTLPENEKQKYLHTSKQLKNPKDLSLLSGKELEKLIQTHRKIVINEVPVVRNL